MKPALLLILFCLLATAGRSDDLTRAVQERLKDQGFFYGAVNGQPGPETSAAIRRYQIRYGLRVTGELNGETRQSLGLTGTAEAPAQPGSGTAPVRPEPRANPQVENRDPSNQSGDAYSDRRFYPDQPRNPYLDPGQEFGPEYQDPGRTDPRYEQPRDLGPDMDYRPGNIFAGTPYDGAPGDIRENVLFAIQGELARRGFYRGPLDGQPGPATFEAIARFQEEEGMAPTGRLDFQTLNELRVLPGQENGPPDPGQFRGPIHQRVYRGIWLR